MPQPCLLSGVEHEAALFSGTVEVMEHLQSLLRIQLHAFGTQCGEVGDQVSAGAGKVGARLLNVLLLHGDREILLLHDAVAARGLVQQHLVVLFPVHIQTVVSHGHEDSFFKVPLIDAVVVDGDFGGGPAVQTVQQLGVGQEHAFLILAAGNEIVDVGEAVHLRVLVPDE